MISAGQRSVAPAWVLMVIGTCAAGYLAATSMAADPVPAPVITGHPAGRTRARMATFGYADRSRAARLQCSLDGAPPAPCPAGGITYRGLAPGRHLFTVTARRGSQASRPARFAWRVIAARRSRPRRAAGRAGDGGPRR